MPFRCEDTLLEYKEWMMMSMSLLTSAWNVNFSAPSFGLNILDASSLHMPVMYQPSNLDLTPYTFIMQSADTQATNKSMSTMHEQERTQLILLDQLLLSLQLMQLGS